jgi:hypothetical protein
MMASTRVVPIVLAGFIAAVGCKKAHDDEAPTDGPPTRDLAEAKQAVEAQRDKVNKLVPPELRDRLKFVAKSGKGDHTVSLVPEGWGAGVIPGSFEPSDKEVGSTSSFRVGSNCDGMCKPKDWASIVEKVEYEGVKSGGIVKKDEKKPDSRTIVVEGEWGGKRRVLVVVARWNEKASRYFACRVDVDGAYADAADAFEEACRGFVVVDWAG